MMDGESEEDTGEGTEGGEKSFFFFSSIYPLKHFYNFLNLTVGHIFNDSRGTCRTLVKSTLLNIF